MEVGLCIFVSQKKTTYVVKITELTKSNHKVIICWLDIYRPPPSLSGGVDSVLSDFCYILY